MYLHLSCLLRLIHLYCLPLTEQAPPPRVDTKESVTAESGVTTLDRVAVSNKKMKMIYIKWGKVGPVRLGNSVAPDNESGG